MTDAFAYIGAVARQVESSDPESIDTLELFDTRSNMRHKVRDILVASSNAPCFFPTPVNVGRAKYVDGGVGGNCPLAQAIPRLRVCSFAYCLTTGLFLNYISKNDRQWTTYLRGTKFQ